MLIDDDVLYLFLPPPHTHTHNKVAAKRCGDDVTRFLVVCVTSGEREGGRYVVERARARERAGERPISFAALVN